MFDRSTPAAVANGRKWAAAAILCGLAILVVFTLRDVVVVQDDPLPGRDSVNLYVWELYTRKVLATGKLPFWNPFHFAGTPHLADVQTTVLYPPAMLLRWLPPGAFLSWMAALHVWIAGAGVLFLGRVIGLGWLASTAVAVAGMLGGSAGARLHNGHLLLLYCAAWLPWALGFAIVSVRRATVWPHPGLVVVLALQFLAGYVQGSFYLVGVVCLYYAYSALWPESGGDVRSRARTIGQLVVAGLLSLGVSAFQLFPTARLVAQAARFAGIPYQDAIEGGWYARNYLSFFFPFYGITSTAPHRDLAEAVSYVGWVLTPMIPLAFFDSARRRIAIFLAMMACIALAIVSVDLPFYRLHHAIFPGFRFPGRVLFLATLSLAVLGGIGLERFVALASARRWRSLVPGLIPGTLAIVAAAFIVLSASNQRPPAPAWPWLPILALMGLVAAGALAGRARTVALSITLALVVTDIAAFTSGALSPVSVESTDTVRQWMGPPNPGRAISTCENRISAGEMLRNSQPGLDGLAGIMLNDYSDWADVASSGNPLPHDGQFHGIDTEGVFPARRDLLDAANVALVYSCAPLDAPSLTLVSHIDGVYAYRNDAARPRAFWTCAGQMMTRAAATERILRSRFDREGRLLPRAYINVRWAPDVTAERRRSIEQGRSLGEGAALDDRTWRYSLEDPSTANVLALMSDAAVEDTHGVDRITGAIAQVPVAADEGASVAGDEEMVTGTLPCADTGTVDIPIQDRPDGRVVANVQATKAGYIFLSEPFYPEREAFVDGQRVTPVRANIAFTAVPVPAGSHQVELVYTPTSFRLGLGLSLLTIVLWAGLSRRQRVR